MRTIERVTAPTADLRALVSELDAWLARYYSPEQRHGVTLDGLFAGDVRFYVAYEDGAAAGCGGMVVLDDYAEIKRMYVREHARGSGVARDVLAQIERDAIGAGVTLLRLETGIHQPAAQKLYARAGFARCAAFGGYATMPPQTIVASVFMEKRLTA